MCRIIKNLCFVGRNKLLYYHICSSFVSQNNYHMRSQNKILTLLLQDCNSDCHAEDQQMLSDFGFAKCGLLYQLYTNQAIILIKLAAALVNFYLYSLHSLSHVTNINIIIHFHEKQFHLFEERIKGHNANFIRDKSALVLASIHQLVIRRVKYDFLAGQGYNELFEI